MDSVSHGRRTDPSGLGKLVRGDLDWIVMKALDKVRNRRYESPSEFGADTERFLDGSPIVARPPSKTYQFRRFAARNKGLFISGSVVGLTLFIGLIGTITGWQDAIQKQHDLEDKQIELLEVLRDRDNTLARLRDEISGRCLNLGWIRAAPFGAMNR